MWSLLSSPYHGSVSPGRPHNLTAECLLRISWWGEGLIFLACHAFWNAGFFFWNFAVLECRVHGTELAASYAVGHCTKQEYEQQLD